MYLFQGGGEYLWVHLLNDHLTPDFRSVCLTGIRGGSMECGGPGACFNKHDGLFDRATDHPPMLFVHCRMVGRPVRRPSCLLKHSPGHIESSFH